LNFKNSVHLPAAMASSLCLMAAGIAKAGLKNQNKLNLKSQLESAIFINSINQCDANLDQ
jgi:hypothetical protein